MDNLRLTDIGDCFVYQFNRVYSELESARKVAKEYQDNDDYESLASGIDKKMDNLRQMYQQLEERFDKLCEETGYVSEYKQ